MEFLSQIYYRVKSLSKIFNFWNVYLGSTIAIICMVAFVLLTGCQNVCPDKTTVNISTTDTESVNKDNEDRDKFQMKKSISQSWKWGKKHCKDERH